MQFDQFDLPMEYHHIHEKEQIPVLKQLINIIPLKAKTMNEIINNTIETFNFTTKNVEFITNDNNQAAQSFEDDWNILYVLRVMLYILVIAKLLELIFSKRRKMDIKQRIYKKYIFSHAQMIRQFDEEDRKVMQITLNNTIKNAYIEKNRPKSSKKTSNKKVAIHQIKNQYIEPRKAQPEQNIYEISNLQAFLSSTDPISFLRNQIMRRGQDEPQPTEKEFQLVQTIVQKGQTNQNDKMVSQIPTNIQQTENDSQIELSLQTQDYKEQKSL